MNLVIVESPTKAKMLSRFLGDSYRVEATMGHIRDLPRKKLGVSIEKSNGEVSVKPEYVQVTGKRERIEQLKKSAAKADTVILATDPDREGEAIAWHSAVLLDGARPKAKGQGSKEFQRVVFHQITKEAILEAMKHPRGVDLNLVDAQQARRVLDRVVGYKLSPLLWKKIRRGLSAGRVQSVAVRLIVDREREIEAFVSQEYWEIYVTVSKATEKFGASEAFDIKLIEIEGKKAELSKKEHVDPVVADLRQAAYRVREVEKKEVRRHPYPPFTTSTLQQAASGALRWSGKRTMSVAQQLYEHGFITYHRTDSFHLAGEAVAAVRTFIPHHFNPQYLPERPNFYRTKSALAQEAHEAIRVTNLDDINHLEKIGAEIGRMGSEAVRLYELIWRRFVACQMTDQIYDQTTISVDATGSRRYGLRVQGQVEKFDGWRKAYQSQGRERKVESAKGEQQMLPEVQQGEELRQINVNPQQNFTQPPLRYTEAMLIKALESRGIGRPSTYAPTVSTIQDRGYIEKEESRFRPSPVGLVVNDFLVQHFSQIVDYDFTRAMEEDLDHIAEGKQSWQAVIGEFWLPFEDHLGKVENSAQRQKVPVEETGEMCPECKEGKQVIRSGKFGKFLSCSRFPDCRWTGKLIEKIGVKCPECGQGEVVIKKTRKGKRFYGCSRYPDCKWASWKKPAVPSLAPA